MKITILLALISGLPACETYAIPQNAGKNFIVGYSKNVFRGFNVNDARVAASLIENAVIKEGVRKASNFSVTINDPSDVVNLVKQNKLDFVSLTSAEYLSIRDKTKIYPYVAPIARDNILNRLLLLVRKDSNIKSVSDLKNKKISSSSDIDENYKLPTIWLKVLLGQNKITNIKGFVSAIKVKDNPSLIVSDVFFKNSDACIIFESEFETLKELNPQLGNNLKILFASEPLLTEVGCYTENSKSDPDLNIVIKTTYELHTSSNGRNLLKLLKIKQLLPYKEEYLHNVEKLYRDFIRLSR